MEWLPRPPVRAAGEPAQASDGVEQMLVAAVSASPAALCLTDERDRIRFANETFRRTFIPRFDGTPCDFMDAICEAIANGEGIKLESVPLDEFKVRVRSRRASGNLFAFCTDCHDGSWWRMEDHRMPNGWILAVGTDISALKHDEARLREAYDKAVEAAQTDFLTGLANRRCGMEQAQAGLDAAAADRSAFTLALLDIDHFKRINDLHGHDTGDKVLMHFAQALTQRLGLRDRVSRIGGEEFMVVMAGTTLAGARGRLERLLRTLPPFPGASGAGLAFTFSAGLACAGEGETLKSLLSRADAALYQAKSAGRQRIEASPQKASDAA